MKSFLLGLILCFGMFFPFYSQSYNNGNGTVINSINVNGITWEIRKHVQQVEIGDIPKEENKKLLSNISQESSIRTIIPEGSKIEIAKIARAKINDEYHVWLNATTENGVNGWLFFGKFSYEYAQFEDPYFDNRWEITGYITTSQQWTIRKMSYQDIAVWEVVNIRDKPGSNGTIILSKIISPDKNTPQINLLVKEATEEKEIINGRKDRWLRIVYNNVDGWIFGGYASVERGGPKYYTPENIIASGLGYFP